jgi:hypothetical protein
MIALHAMTATMQRQRCFGVPSHSVAPRPNALRGPLRCNVVLHTHTPTPAPALHWPRMIEKSLPKVKSLGGGGVTPRHSHRSGSMSGRWRRNKVCGSEPPRGNPDARTYRCLNHRATSRLFFPSAILVKRHPEHEPFPGRDRCRAVFDRLQPVDAADWREPVAGAEQHHVAQPGSDFPAT